MKELTIHLKNSLCLFILLLFVGTAVSVSCPYSMPIRPTEANITCNNYTAYGPGEGICASDGPPETQVMGAPITNGWLESEYYLYDGNTSVHEYIAGDFYTYGLADSYNYPFPSIKGRFYLLNATNHTVVFNATYALDGYGSDYSISMVAPYCEEPYGTNGCPAKPIWVYLGTVNATGSAYLSDIYGGATCWLNSTESLVQCKGWMKIKFQPRGTGLIPVRSSQWDLFTTNYACNFVHPTWAWWDNNSYPMMDVNGSSVCPLATVPAINPPTTICYDTTMTSIGNFDSGTMWTEGSPVELGDADNDGQVEMYINFYNQTNDFENIRRFSWDNASASWLNYLIPSSGGGRLDNPVLALTIGDADNNGLNELLVVRYMYYSSPPNAWYLQMYNYSGGSWHEYNISNTTYSGSWIERSVMIGDFDSDGLNEIATLSDAYTEGMMLFLTEQNGSGDWVSHNISTDVYGGWYGLAHGDIMNDGVDRIVGLIEVAGNENTVVYWSNESGGFTEYNFTNVPWGTSSSGIWEMEWAEVGDTNNDGLNEVAVLASGNWDEGLFLLRTYENLSGGWVETNISQLWDNASDPNSGQGVGKSIAIGDLDNDGLNELVVTRRGGANGLASIQLYTYDPATLSYDFIDWGYPGTLTNSSWMDEAVARIGKATNDGLNKIIWVAGPYTAPGVIATAYGFPMCSGGLCVPAPGYCGDGTCDASLGETTNNCPQDCGNQVYAGTESLPNESELTPTPTQPQNRGLFNFNLRDFFKWFTPRNTITLMTFILIIIILFILNKYR